MDELLKWAVTYQLHTHCESFYCETAVVSATCIGNAIRVVDDMLARRLESHNWSDYNITAVSIIPELH